MNSTLVQLSLLVFTSVTIAETVAYAETRDQAVIYGEDGREDVYAYPDEAFRERAIRSSVALFSAYSLDYSSLDDVRIHSAPYGVAQRLCSSERFTDQPTGAFCSGTIIAPDLVLTAGHCVTDNDNQCPLVRVVTNFRMDDADTLHTLTRDDVYSCTRIVTREENGQFIQSTRDWAIIQLDRPIDGILEPAPVRTTRAPVTDGASLTMIGVPSGIPTKIEGSATVRDARAQRLDYFFANTDSYGGNSGSGVYDTASGDLVGILTSGEQDFVKQGECYVSKQCTESGCGGENIMYAFQAIGDLCAHATDPTLCGTEPVCGDGFCAAGEDCLDDCADVTCGDGICHGGSGADNEWDSCPQDCNLRVPAGWTCNAGLYGRFGECNDNCGVPDPDCAITNEYTGSLTDIGDDIGCAQSSKLSLSLLGLLGVFGLVMLRLRTPAAGSRPRPEAAGSRQR